MRAEFPPFCPSMADFDINDVIAAIKDVLHA